MVIRSDWDGLEVAKGVCLGCHCRLFAYQGFSQAVRFFVRVLGEKPASVLMLQVRVGQPSVTNAHPYIHTTRTLGLLPGFLLAPSVRLAS